MRQITQLLAAAFAALLSVYIEIQPLFVDEDKKERVEERERKKQDRLSEKDEQTRLAEKEDAFRFNLLPFDSSFYKLSMVKQDEKSVLFYKAPSLGINRVKVPDLYTRDSLMFEKAESLSEIEVKSVIAGNQPPKKVDSKEPNPTVDTTRPGLSSLILRNVDSTTLVVEEEEKLFSDLEISGLVIDQTRSKIGRDFYDAFFYNWNTITPPKGDFSIIITEQPIRGSLSQLTVSVNDVTVSQRFLQLRTTEIEEYAEISVNQVIRFMQQEKEMSKRLLREDDQMGSGIY
ncbi:MAG: CsgE family curli-type amyloid fiber assembly protein [Vicingaceae bacterium]